MSEFKFSVGDRVAVRCPYAGYLRGEILSRSRIPVGNYYDVRRDGKGSVIQCREKELTRLVKKNTWGGFKVGQRVLADSALHGEFTGCIVELFGSDKHMVIKIKPDKTLNPPFPNAEWLVGAERCKLIEDEKPNPKREPLRVGERVIIKEDQDPYLIGKKGKIIGILNTENHAPITVQLDGHDMVHKFGYRLKRLIKKHRVPLRVGERVVVMEGRLSGLKGRICYFSGVAPLPIWVLLDNGVKELFLATHLKRLIKKPVEFKVGDKVRVKEINLGELGLPFNGVVKKVFNCDGRLRVSTSAYERDDRWVQQSDCVRLRKKPVVFAVGDRVKYKYTCIQGVERIGKGTITHEGSVIKSFLVRTDNAGNEWIFNKYLVKLRKRRLRVGDRVKFKTYMDGMKTGEIILDDKSWKPFHIREDGNGETWWAYESDCKRLVRKKKKVCEPGSHVRNIVNAWRFYLKSLKHVPASGKKVEGGEFCECHTMILFHRDNDPSVCAKCSKFFKPGVIPITDTPPESEFCECQWKRGYDKHGIHVQSVVSEEDFAKNKNSVNPCYKEIKRHRQDDFLVKQSTEKEKHVCNPALWGNATHYKYCSSEID
jgi:transcription antitermination factor NusG